MPIHRTAAWLWLGIGLGLGLCTASLNTAAQSVAQPASQPAAIDPEGFSGWTDKPGWTATHDMIAAAHPLAVDAGQQMLRAGGTAIDAAIAAQMVLTLVEPQSSGIGGGGFLLHADRNATVQAYDGRETAPAAATPALFQGADGQPMRFFEAAVGGRSVGAPGLLRMLEKAHQAHGRLPWADLFRPAIRLADSGFPVSHRLATLLRQERYLANDPEARAYFFRTDGTPHTAGTQLRNPALAQTLRVIASQGADVFYRGNIARDIVRKVRHHPRNPGTLSLADLAGYKAIIRTPLCAPYRQWRICGMPPPSSGGLAIAQTLGMLEALPPGLQIAHFPPQLVQPMQSMQPAASPQPAEGRREPSPTAVHLITEAERLAYADRNRYVADPDFTPAPGGAWSTLIDPVYLKRRAALIGESSMGHASAGDPVGDLAHHARHAPNAPSLSPSIADDSLELPSTTHLSVIDRYGNAVSMTTSIENQFGSRLMVHGFLLNNQLTDFSFTAEMQGKAVANRVEGGKRPRSSMSPTLVFDRDTGKLALSVGSPGGSAIIPYVVKTLVGTLDWGLDLQSAIALPNFGSRNGPTELEDGQVSPALREALQARGHAVRLSQQVSGLHGIERIERGGRDGQPVWLGGADPRREGMAAGQ